MKQRTKIALLGLLACAIGAAWWFVVLPRRRIHQLRDQFTLVQRGDSEDVVRRKIESANLITSSLSAPFWDEAPLDEEMKQVIASSLEVRIDTFFLPVIAVISFDPSGNVVGKHLYD